MDMKPIQLEGYGKNEWFIGIGEKQLVRKIRMNDAQGKVHYETVREVKKLVLRKGQPIMHATDDGVKNTGVINYEAGEILAFASPEEVEDYIENGEMALAYKAQVAERKKVPAGKPK